MGAEEGSGGVIASARVSAAGVKTHLYIAHDLGYVSSYIFASTYNSVDKIARMTGSLMRYLKQNVSKTSDFRRATR
ncbi:four helix bundle protein [bacterium]|nr:four helix bundle protein [bacterium]